MSHAHKTGLFALLILVATALGSCTAQIETSPIAEPEQETAGTGILVADSYPSGADVYVDGELKGTTPSTIYRVLSGEHIITIRKEGYSDFQKSVAITPGRTEEIRAPLNEMDPKVPAQETLPKETIAAEPKPGQAPQKPDLGSINKTSIDRKFTLYFDFDNGLITDLRKSKTDVFFKNYKTYLYYTALYPARLMVADRPIREISKENCASADQVVAKVLSGQTLCVKTMEGSIAAIGGSWETEPEELEWVLFK